MRGRALLIATSVYNDSQLSTLQSTRIDVEGLRLALADSHIGDFQVSSCIDAPCQSWRESIEEFFAEATPNELLLLYISGHAIKDIFGRLFFAATDTRLNRLIASGIPSTLIQEASNNSRSQRIAMIFDTCFSGAFAKGMVLKDGEPRSIDASAYFHEGSGKVVITASNALQYALSGDSVEGRSSPSVFSKHLIEGLRTGNADVDGDGNVTTEDLFRYISNELRLEHIPQQPQRWSFGVTGDFVIASNPAPRPGRLPDDITELIADSRPRVRALAVQSLEVLLSGSNIPLALAARQELLRLQDDDSRSVQNAARAALQHSPPPKTTGLSAVEALSAPVAPTPGSKRDKSVSTPMVLSSNQITTTRTGRSTTRRVLSFLLEGHWLVRFSMLIVGTSAMIPILSLTEKIPWPGSGTPYPVMADATPADPVENTPPQAPAENAPAQNWPRVVDAPQRGAPSTMQISVPIGTKIKIITVSDADPHSDYRLRLFGKTGVAASELKRHGAWWSGEVTLDEDPRGKGDRNPTWTFQQFKFDVEPY